MWLVSVVIPAYNAASFLPTAIRSVLAQTYGDYEITVVDDGSSDETPDIVKQFSDAVQYVYQEHSGSAAARNHGIAKSTGDFVAFLDADDVWVSVKLQRQIAVFRDNPDAGIVHTGMYFCDEDLRPFNVWLPRLGCGVYEKMLTQFLGLCTSSVLMRKSCLDALGGFDTSLFVREDWDLWLRAAYHYPLLCIDEPLVLHRVRSNSKSTWALEMREAYLKILEKHFSKHAAQRILALKKDVYAEIERFVIQVMLLNGQHSAVRKRIVRYFKTFPRKHPFAVLGYLLLSVCPEGLINRARNVKRKVTSLLIQRRDERIQRVCGHAENICLRRER